METGTDPTIEARLARLEARCEALAAENAELRARVAPAAGAVAPVVEGGAGDAGAPAMDRRHLLRNGLGALGAAVAGATLLDPLPAAAADGAALVLGSQSQGATHATAFAVSGADVGYGLGVVDTSYTSSTLVTKAALLAHAKGSSLTTGLQVVADGTAAGIKVNTTGGDGITVNCTSGFGVHATVPGGGTTILGEADAGTAIGGIATSGVGAFGISSTGVGTRGQSLSGNGVQGSSSGANGVQGTSSTGSGVSGSSTSGTGVKGTSTNGYGIEGTSTSNRAVSGTSIAGTGLFGQTTAGIAVIGYAGDEGIGMRAAATNNTALIATASTGGGGVFSADRFQLQLTPYSGNRLPPVADSYSHAAGDVIMDGLQDLYLCVVAGTNGAPGTFRKLSGPATAGSLHVLPTPLRAYDSRPGTQPSAGPKTKLPANTARTIDLNTAVNLPAGTTAAMVTILLVNATAGSGNFTVWANGATRPTSNSLVWGGSDGRFSSPALTAVDGAGRVQVYASLATDLVLDVVGYYR